MRLQLIKPENYSEEVAIEEVERVIRMYSGLGYETIVRIPYFPAEYFDKLRKRLKELDVGNLVFMGTDKNTDGMTIYRD